MISYQDRVLGMLWGLHAGDSLGAPWEFLPPLPAWNAKTEIVGGGKFNWAPGEATDDTDLMLAVMRSLKSSQEISFDILKSEMLAWLASNPPDIGNTTIKGLQNLKAGMPLRECGFVYNAERAQGNGSIMRVAPLALLNEDAVGTYSTDKTLGLREIIITQAKMTHGHQLCVDTDLIFIPAVKAALAGKSKIDIYEAALVEAAKTNPTIYQRLIQIPSISWENLATSGFCVDTLCAGMWAFLKYDTLEEALISVVNRGDDSDSCGAVAGVLCGAYYGSQAIPKRWVEKLEYRAEIQQLVFGFFRHS
ncbi:ADP-ribosylglycohydrolase family protein [Bdellovibrio sp. SKB1291214]|uniref:ADP-ribosylglycohydrolase family protein n=1 Tax=Bdellovibrio sp. SKB1291214 TaxID=1732569 RepID=UPI000B518C5F|nr:ADP-ribosylglycohydrolase family protein [Bdellovibrio sp. SKB1291214]UYL09498.1 ADP-ribosylglycohydrolase family protein [Bdellovibrio sp. SKB1291214]